MPLLEAKRLDKQYALDGVTVHALRGVDLIVDQGEFLAVMGPSGCGKSTLLHLLGALDTPTTGDVLLEGTALAAMTDDELTEVRRHRVGFVFQFFNLVPVLTALENVALPAIIDGRSRADANRRAGELLDRFGLAADNDKLPSQLSGGQQQRVAIARALMNEPAVLLADEPTGNLDHRSGVQVVEHFAALHAGGQTTVLVTHNPAVAAVADRVVFLRDGEVVGEERGGTADSLLARLVSLDAPA
jgi:putative ABC transport system ATP-binding protein